MRRRAIGVSVALVLLCVLAGCDQGGNRKILDGNRSPGEYMIIAVTDPDPDVRREAVGRVARSRKADEEWAVDGFITIALLDSDTQARCVAVRGLEEGRDPRSIDALLKLLNHRNYKPEEVKPPAAVLRADASLALARLCESGMIVESQREPLAATFLNRLSSDEDRHVRIASARGLANFPGDETLRGLIAGLRDTDFAVVHRCEESLVRLTGVSHHCVAAEWERWYEENKGEPFVRAGQVPDSRKPPYSNKLGESWYKTKRFWRTIFPPQKGE
ncbi:MAG: HEAT repeat domain-containing protein [Phycisphaerae bacterium]